ncbi:2-phosphosulfolactate phosphatase [Paraliobacillus zengyii]|uniref:2-phosphosulfolactate phosphatase n=1 Tax=Paraliobacillus zengyii TaxID=2213194 RepID=UPI000DD4A349|nr:2-phosphosulfolactate phosphatase [Paraliobacillus zengyii]
MQIYIYQGATAPPTVASITIVIDVIRAFTVAHYAFLQGANRIYLAEKVEQAFQIKNEHTDYLLTGEIDGLAIKGFDLDNSPYNIKQKNLVRKTLIQKTTNGVKVTLNCLSSEHIFVTGFTNAKKTAEFIKNKLITNKIKVINIIASHPNGDDDLACATYIKSILDGSNSMSNKEVKERIIHSHVAERFLDEGNVAFNFEDILYCIKELNTNFVMKINKSSEIPVIERVNV